MPGATYGYGSGSATLSTQPGEGYAGASGLESGDFADFIKQMVRRRLSARPRPQPGRPLLGGSSRLPASGPEPTLERAPLPTPSARRRPIWLRDMSGLGTGLQAYGQTPYVRLDRFEPGAVYGGSEEY